jgi:hypothetical protein
MQRNRALQAVASLLAMAVFALAPASMATGATTPNLIGVVHATVSVGGVTVSWTQARPTVTYTVERSGTSTPLCTVVGGSRCFVAVAALGSWSFVVVATSGSAQSTSPPTPPIAAHLTIVVAGQSNAIGATSFTVDPLTHVNFMAPPYVNGADTEDVIRWKTWFTARPPSAITSRNGTVPLDTPQYQTEKHAPHLATFGPELGIARQIWEDTRTPLTIIKAAYPGSSLAVDWNPLPGHGTLYAGMTSLVRATMTTDAAAGRLDVLGAFVWFQGEADAGDVTWASAYQTNLTNLITAVRTDLPSASMLPIGIIEPSTSSFIAATCGAACPGHSIADTEVRAAVAAVGQTISGVVVVDSITADRTAASNFVHLSNLGELQVGSDIAKATEPLIPGLS